MAIDTATRFSLTVVDELGTEASATFYAQVDGAVATPASLLAMWAVLAQGVDAVTSGQITKGSVSILADPTVVTGPILKTAPEAGSRVEQTAILNFSNPITPHRFGEAIPALADDNILSGKVNLTAGQPVPLLITLLTTATSAFEWATNNQQALVALVDALISFRKRRKQLSRSSFER
jgi:hypothetical protein